MVIKLTAKEVASRLHLNIQTVWKFVRTGRIPYQRAFGRRPILFDEDVIENFLKNSGGKHLENENGPPELVAPNGPV